MIVEVEQVEPDLDVFAVLVELADAPGKELEGLDIAIPAALAEVGAPLLDLPWVTFVRRILLNPSQHLAATFAGRELDLEGSAVIPVKRNQ